jgi:hypothetical protein
LQGYTGIADALDAIRHCFVDIGQEILRAPEILTQDLRPMKIGTTRSLFRYERPRWRRARTQKLDEMV